MHIIACGTLDAASQNDAYDELSLGRAPWKRRKHEGLNARLGRMLQRLDSSFVADPSVRGTKRTRNSSHGSSSSTVISELPRTPIDMVHESIKSNSVGEGFTIIKAGGSPDKCRSDNMLSDNLPSWRNVDRRNVDIQENRQHELPRWLSQTFATLEADHPLRVLALSDNSDSLHGGTEAADSQEQSSNTAPTLDDARDDSVFAFTLPQVLSPRRRFTDQTADDEAPLLLPTGDASGGIFLPTDGFVCGDAQSRLPSPVPFTQPGPFVRKSVHFLTPTRSSPFSTIGAFSDRANRSKVSSNLSYGKHPRSSSPIYNPYSTPGPAASFSLSHADRGIANSAQAEDYGSDSLTVAGSTNPGDDVSLSGAIDEDASASTLSFASNTEEVQEKPFSTPGPTFFNLSDQNIDFPAETLSSPDLTPLFFGNEKLLLADGVRADQKEMRFVEKDHNEMTRHLQESVDIVSNANSFKQAALELDHETFPSQRNGAKDASGLDQGISEFFRFAEDKLTTPSVTGAFSSPPFMRPEFLKALSDQTSHTSHFKQGTTGTDCSGAPISPHMRLESPQTPARFTHANDEKLTVSETSYPLQTSLDHEKSLTAQKVSILASSTNFLDKEHTSPKLVMTPNPSRTRKAFAPAPGIYISPIYDDSTNRPEYGNDIQLQESAGGVASSGTTNEAVWNINASQLSDDSIEDWEI